MIVSFVFADGTVLHAFAEESNKKIYTYDNFDVEYQVDSAWDGAQAIKVKITNTGEESILNWYLKYNAGGTVENLYNALLYSDSATECVFKNNGYNYEIEPNCSVDFGYILRGEELKYPDEFELCNKRVEKETGYDVDFNITYEWDNGFNADIVITNTSDKPIEAWTLTFDANFEVNNYWNCKLIDHSNGKYTFANKLWTTPIAVGGSAVFGFSADMTGDGKPYAENWSMTEVVVDIPVEEEESEFSLVGFAEYDQETGSLIISWFSEYESGSFEVLYSDDGINFNSIAIVEDVDYYEYKITEAFSKRYFKIKQTLSSGRTGESDVLIVCKSEDGYSMEYPDTDNDDVPDYLETAFGLDINKADTDDDGLTDNEEMFLTGTDPTVYDSVKQGVSDADADSDDDGLSNKREIALETDPVLLDTDNDGLSDGDEVNKYNTDPLKADTDGDGINDSDEIYLGLDPLNPNTYGVPDAEYIFDVTLSEDSEAMSEINKDNDYKLSIEITAAGNVENNIDVKESDYSETIKNSAIVGKTFDIEYDTSCKTEKIVLKFELEKDVIDESESDIERFCAFKFFEDYNIILPVYTEYNSNENLVYAQVDELGTYCLMDMEKLVANLSGSSYENLEPIAAFSLANAPVVYTDSSNVLWQNSIDKSSINVVFMIDIRKNFDRECFDTIKDNVVKAAAEVLKESPNARIYLILQHYDKASRGNLGYTIIEDDDEVYFTDSNRIFDELDYLQTRTVDEFHSYCILSDAVKYVFDNCDNSRGTYCFSIFDSNYVVYRTSLVGEDITGVTESDDYGYEVLNRLAENQIDVSIISNIAPEYSLGYAIDLYKSTGGVYIDGLSNFSDEVLKHIYGYIPNHDRESIVCYNGLNFEEMKLDEEITEDCLIAAEELQTEMLDILNSDDRSSLTEIRDAYSEYSDSDDDFVYDFEEIDVFNPLIDWDNDGSIILPTIEDYCDIIGDKKVTKAMKEYIEENWDPLLTINVMPIISDPMKSDTDDDGFVDYYEVLYNRSKAVSAFSLDNDDNNNELFIYDPIKANEWKPNSEVARLTMIGGYSYDPKQHIIYSNKTPIQRFFGFANTVDTAANPILSSAILCDPIYFYYDGKEYRLEFWKGQYGIMAGSEVGLYYREPCVREIDPFGIIKYYDDAKGTEKWYRSAVDEDLIKVSYDYIVDSKTDETDIIEFERDDKHWWTTGFKWGAKTLPNAPKMNITIEFKNEEMKNAFLTGGEIPSAVSSKTAGKMRKEKDHDAEKDEASKNNKQNDKKEYPYQTWGFINALNKSNLYQTSDYSQTNNSVTFSYQNAIINMQPQDQDHIGTILKANIQFLKVYEKVKEYADISFEESDVRFTNDPNFMDIDMWKNAFEETGYLHCKEYIAWKNQFYIEKGELLELNKKSPSFRLIWELGGGSTSLGYSMESMKCLKGAMDIRFQSLGIKVNLDDLLGLFFALDNHLDTLVEYGKTVANTVYRNDNGEKGYIYEWYPRWYAQYERTINSNISIWYYNSEEGKPDVKYGDYIYAMNHLPGMTYSLMYIYKCIEKIHP